MTDMRATERLLEVIEYQVGSCLPVAGYHQIEAPLRQAMEAVQELRRRGDTLVRRDDLRLVVDGIGNSEAEIDEALDRLENAIGGKL